MIYMCVGLLLSAAATQAQDFSLTTLPTQNLLPSASVHCIFQDSEGYMWYGTEGGLCRDNGYQVDVFRPSALDAYSVHCIAEDARGNILFGTADGLYAICKHDYRLNEMVLDSTRHSVEAIYEDSRHHLWVGVKGSVFEFDEAGNMLKRHPCLIAGIPSATPRPFRMSSMATGLHEASVASICEDQHGTLYVMQWRSGIMRKRKGESSFSPLHWPLSATPLQMIEDTQYHCFWVLTSGEGIQRMTIEGNVCVLTAQSATMGDENRKRALYMLRDARNGLFWTTTLDNLYAYTLDDDASLQEFPLTGLLPSGKKILDQMCQDKNGNLYVAGFTPHTFVMSSAHKDIKRLTTDAIRRYTGYPLLADRSVHDGHRYIWVWQGRQGLMLYDRESDRVEAVPIRPERAIRASSWGGIWVCSGSVVYRLWQNEGAIRQEEVARTPEGSCICQLYEKDGQALYVATDSRLYRLTLIGHQFSEMAELPSAPHEMAVTENGSVYLAMGASGLYEVSADGKVQRLADMAESFLSVAAMSDGSVWASTNEGNVYRFNPADHQISLEPLLSSRSRSAIKCIRTDGLGHIWTLTDQQVCEYAPQSRAFRTFRNTDPFIDISYFYALEAIDASRMCLDGAGALIEVQSSSELSVQKVAQVQPRLTAVVVGNEKRYVGCDEEMLHLSADEEDFTLEFSTLDHLHASSTCFAYQIDDSHDTWIYLPQGSNSIIVTNLPKGDHRFRVMATDRHGLWSEPVDVITIHRAPHWWETWWACLLYICIAGLVVYAIWRLERRIHLLRRLIRRRQEVRLDEIELKRDDIAEQQRNDEFLKRAIAKTEEHLSEPDYNVESLSADMCMSRITLYRRIQEQTGQTPVEFIRDIRLKKAASLITQHPDAAISDVARKVGFSTPKYFSKCFKEKFGVLPKDYLASDVSE